MRTLLLASLLATGMVGAALAQDALPPNYAVQPKDAGDGHAPGMHATELSPKTRNFHLTFQKGDDPAAGRLFNFGGEPQPNLLAEPIRAHHEQARNTGYDEQHEQRGEAPEENPREASHWKASSRISTRI